MRTVTVSGTYLAPSGSPLGVKIRFTPTSALKKNDDGTIILSDPVWALTNGKGYFEVQLVPRQDGLEPSRFLYQVDEYLDKQLLKSWYMRLDENSPDTVTIPALYPPITTVPDDISIYPTIDDVRLIAADLDRPILTQLALVESTASLNLNTIAKKVDQDDIGVTVASLNNGVIPSSQLPVVRFQNTWYAESDSAMLALSADVGDVCIRPDLGQSKVLVTNDPADLNNWKNLSSDYSVTSINSQTGDVFLTPVNLGAAAYDHGHDVLSGYDYAVTYLRGAVINALQWLDVSDGGDQIRIDTRTITFEDAAGNTIYTIDPYNPTPWSPFDITVLNEAFTPITPVGSLLAVSQARQATTDVIEMIATITNWPSGWAFSIDNATALTGVYSGIFGTWTSADTNGTILGGGIAAVNASNQIELVGLSALVTSSGVAQTNMTIKVRGSFHTSYVAITELLPDVNNTYRLQIGTIQQGVLDAQISGNWPVQTLDLTLPDTGTSNIPDDYITEDMLSPALADKLNATVDKLLVLSNGELVPDGTTAGTVIVRYSPPVTPLPRITPYWGAGNSTTLNVNTVGVSPSSISVPANTMTGDLLVAVCVCENAAPASNWAVPSGWTIIDEQGATRAVMVAVFPAVDAAAITNLGDTVDFTAPSEADGGRAAYAMFRVREADMAAPDAGNSGAWTAGSTADVTAAGFTGSQAIGLRFMVVEVTYAANIAPLAGDFATLTQMVSFNGTNTVTNATTQLIIGYEDAADAASVGTETFTLSAASSNALLGLQFGLKTA